MELPQSFWTSLPTDVRLRLRSFKGLVPEVVISGGSRKARLNHTWGCGGSPKVVATAWGSLARGYCVVSDCQNPGRTDLFLCSVFVRRRRLDSWP